MQKIALITGIGGMDAKTLTHLLLSKNYHVIGTYRRNTQLVLSDIQDLFTQDLLKYPESKLTFETVDITDQNSVNEVIKNVLRKYGHLDELYMIAGMSHVQASFTQKEYSVMANGQSYYYFLECLKHNSRSTRTYGALTSELAGNVPVFEKFNEATKWNPKSPYSIGKALGGHWIKFFRESTDSQLFACFGILFNHSNTYRTKDFFIRKVTNLAAKIALGKADEIRLGHLNFWRDEHYSDFGVEAMWLMLQQNEPKDYVIATGDTHNGEEFMDLAFNYFNLNWTQYVKYDESFLRPNEVYRLIGDSAKAQKDLGWRPNRMSFKDHIDLMCKYDFELESGKTPVRPNVFELYP